MGKNELMGYQDLKDTIRIRLNNAAEDFFVVGYLLRQVSESGMFAQDGYKNIWEFAKGEYGLSTSSASRFMAINARFSVDGGETMAERYIGMGVSKLQEMLGLPDEELERVTRETTVREIREMKRKQEEPLSFFGVPKTEREEHSYTYTPGCGDGKHSCFLCVHPCAIRQEERQCRTAACGNPFPCSRLNNEEWKKYMEHSLHKDLCQLLHHELAPVTSGSNEPDPCCLQCDITYCYSRCDIAKEQDKEKERQRRREQRQRQKEEEAGRPDMTQEEVEELYSWLCIKVGDELTAAYFSEKYGKFHQGDGRFSSEPRGVRTTHGSKVMTWGWLVKQFKEIQRRKAEGLQNEPGEAQIMTEFYEVEVYPSIRNVISGRDKKAATKIFKEEYGRSYTNGMLKCGVPYYCYPDKITFKLKTEQIQIMWGKFVTRLFRLLDQVSAIEGDALALDAKAARPEESEEGDVIDVDFHEVEDGDGPKPDIGESETGTETGTGDKDDEDDDEADVDPEEYDLSDIKGLLRTNERMLAEYKDVGGCPPNLLKKQRILVDALSVLVKKMEEMEEE